MVLQPMFTLISQMLPPDTVSSEFLAAFQEMFQAVIMDEYIQHAVSNGFTILYSKERIGIQKCPDVNKYIEVI